MYYVFIISCEWFASSEELTRGTFDDGLVISSDRAINGNTKNFEIIEVDGTVVFLNPFGYLRGELYPNLWFYGFLAFFGYLLLLLIPWLVLSWKHRRNLLRLQVSVFPSLCNARICPVRCFLNCCNR
jgi:hypothetical protein